MGRLPFACQVYQGPGSGPRCRAWRDGVQSEERVAWVVAELRTGANDEFLNPRGEPGGGAAGLFLGFLGCRDAFASGDPLYSRQWVLALELGGPLGASRAQFGQLSIFRSGRALSPGHRVGNGLDAAGVGSLPPGGTGSSGLEFTDSLCPPVLGCANSTWAGEMGLAAPHSGGFLDGPGRPVLAEPLVSLACLIDSASPDLVVSPQSRPKYRWTLWPGSGGRLESPGLNSSDTLCQLSARGPCTSPAFFRRNADEFDPREAPA